MPFLRPPRRLPGRFGAVPSVLLSLLCVLGPVAVAGAQPIEVRVSSEDGRFSLSALPDLRWSEGPGEAAPASVVDETTRFQTMLGMGSSLEPTSAYNLSRLEPGIRREVIRSLVDDEDGIGMNLMRISIGTPDFTGDPWYSYADLPNGAADPELEHFSVARDEAYILPVLRIALEENPELLFFASPWSPPGWMTSTGDMIGGFLLEEYYPTYARYFVRFVDAYGAAGVPIHAVTVQNEPGVDRSRDDPEWHYPSCHWTAEQERVFVAEHLGPAFGAAGLATRIWSYDHNYNTEPTADGDDPGLDHPRTILRDPRAARYVDGVAFHGYAGEPEAMSLFHEEFPAVPIHFTEGSVFGVDGAVELIRILRNHASSYNVWVTMIDEQGGPNNGPFEATRTMVTLDSSADAGPAVHYHFDYFMYGQFMKFVERGAVRIASDWQDGGPPNVAFVNPDDSIVLILVNPVPEWRDWTLAWRDRSVEVRAAPRSVITLRWRGALDRPERRRGAGDRLPG